MADSNGDTSKITPVSENTLLGFPMSKSDQVLEKMKNGMNHRDAVIAVNNDPKNAPRYDC